MRGMLKTFPYSESQLLQQMVMQLAKTAIVSTVCLSVSCLSVRPSVRLSEFSTRDAEDISVFRESTSTVDGDATRENSYCK